MGVNRYIVTINMPGYLPEADPYVIECDPDSAPIPQVLEIVSAEVERAAPERDDDTDEDGWDRLVNEIENDRERADDLDEAGVSYLMPDGYRINANRVTISELIDCGYSPDIDAYGDREQVQDLPPNIDLDHPDWCPSADEIAETVRELHFQAAYGKNR